MDYITVKEAAERWQVSERRVQILCNTDRIKGAYRFGKSDDGEDNTCYHCTYYEKCEELLGVCRCKTRQRKNE